MINLIKNILTTYFEHPLLLVETIVLFAICILLKRYYPNLRGHMGEFWVKNTLKKLPKEKYSILHDVMIKDQDGTHQIDHIVLSNHGLFVIETKNYYGFITGREYDKKWCQHFGKQKNYFLNPIHQNYGHIKCLSKLLKIDEKYFISIICFSNQAKLKVQSKSIVTQIDSLKKQVETHFGCPNEFDLEKIALFIKSRNIVLKKERKKHVQTIKQQRICPQCGNQLIEKKGKFGPFIGCSNYPKCQYTKKKTNIEKRK